MRLHISKKISVLQIQVGIDFQKIFPRSGSCCCIDTWLQSSHSSPWAPSISLWAVINIWRQSSLSCPCLGAVQTSPWHKSILFLPARGITIVGTHKWVVKGSNLLLASSSRAIVHLQAPEVELANFCRELMTQGEVLVDSAAQTTGSHRSHPCASFLWRTGINEVLTRNTKGNWKERENELSLNMKLRCQEQN